MKNKKEYVGLHVWYIDEDVLYDEGEYYGGFETFSEAQAKAKELMTNKVISSYDIYVK